MNTTIQLIKNHRSIRSYLPQAIDDQQLEAILDAAHQMPTSINGQQVSVIVVKDTIAKQKIAAIAGGQKWIEQAPVFLLFVVDYYKTAIAGELIDAPQVIHQDPEGLLVGVFDCGLAMGGAIIAAESLGLGIVPIGGIRRDPQAIIDLLQLPPMTYPAAGLVLGHPADFSALKPRLSKTSFIHVEKYTIDGLREAIADYDRLMADYYIQGGRPENINWSHQTGHTYKQVYFPHVAPTLKSQGFLKQD